jgi:hypothetical protein
MIQYSTTTLTLTRSEYLFGSFSLLHSFVDFFSFTVNFLSFSPLISRPHNRLVLDNKTRFKLRHETKPIYASQSQSLPPSPPTVAPSLFLSSLQYLSPPALGQHFTDATTRQPYALILISFYFSFYTLTPSLFNPHHRHPRGRLYYTKLRHSQQVARMYLRQPSCSSRRASISIERFLFISTVLFSSLGGRPWNCCPRDLGRSLAPCSLSRLLSLSFSLSLSPSLVWSTFSPRNNYPRRISFRLQ